jgi:hypothetical protein
MYDNIKEHGVAHADHLYKAPGREVTRVFKDNEKKSKSEIVKLMTDKINEIGLEKVTRHAPSSTHETFDIAPSSIKNKKAFVEAIEARVKTGEISTFLKPPVDPAYHIEIPK